MVSAAGGWNGFVVGGWVRRFALGEFPERLGPMSMPTVDALR